MLPRPRRLRSEEVREVIEKGRALRGSLLSARALKEARGGLRAAAVVSKSVAKTAVARNRLRRALYRALSEIEARPSARVVVFLRSVPPKPLAPALRKEIEGILKHIA